MIVTVVLSKLPMNVKISTSALNQRTHVIEIQARVKIQLEVLLANAYRGICNQV